MNRPTTHHMERLLREHFPDARIEIVDESHLHAGHAGARAHGGGHYRLAITSKAFAGLSRVQRHQRVYQALKPLMREAIHALSITAHAPGHED
ncbi:MAG: BolA family transcriptional regulator [Zetaproteobacteria bacterium]|nr:MAG: BolA family transcriptional regulator [Zetaproteobacteria bacterium]